MKKTLIALAALGALSGVAHAQSNITVYGLIDASVRTSTNGNAANDSLNQITDGSQNGSRLGFKGTEDLGNGLKTVFQLESGFSEVNGMSGQGGRLFGRAATLGLSDAKLGTLTVGRQTTLNYDFLGSTDVYGVANPVAMAGYQSVLSGTRWDNSLKYVNSINGLNFGAQYASGNQVGNTKASSAYALTLGYTAGPLSVQGNYQEANDTKDGTLGSLVGQTQKVTGIGATYALSKGKVFAQYVNNKFDVSTQENNIYTVGGLYNIDSQLVAKVSYTNDKQTNVNDGTRETYTALLSYALSKRTDVYTEVDYNQLNSGYSNASYTLNTLANPNTSSTAVAFGLRHTF